MDSYDIDRTYSREHWEALVEVKNRSFVDYDSAHRQGILWADAEIKALEAQVDELKGWGESLACPCSCYEGGLYTDLGHGDFDVERCEWCGKRDDVLSDKVGAG